MEKQKVIFFTGAGISAESGVPTFGEQEGLRDKLTRDYALQHTSDYISNLRAMRDLCLQAQPNAAHLAMAEFNVPIITMNIDGLHQRAGSKNVIDIHGRFPTDEEFEQDNFKFLLNIPVLYGDPAPKYEYACQLVRALEYNNSFFIVVGTSFYTAISEELLHIAKQKKAEIIIINDNAAERVPKILGSKLTNK